MIKQSSLSLKIFDNFAYDYVNEAETLFDKILMRMQYHVAARVQSPLLVKASVYCTKGRKHSFISLKIFTPESTRA